MNYLTTFSLLFIAPDEAVAAPLGSVIAAEGPSLAVALSGREYFQGGMRYFFSYHPVHVHPERPGHIIVGTPAFRRIVAGPRMRQIVHYSKVLPEERSESVDSFYWTENLPPDHWSLPLIDRMQEEAPSLARPGWPSIVECPEGLVAVLGPEFPRLQWLIRRHPLDMTALHGRSGRILYNLYHICSAPHRRTEHVDLRRRPAPEVLHLAEIPGDQG